MSPGHAAGGRAEFERRKDAWTADPAVDDISIGTDMTPTMLAALYHGGRIDRVTFRDRRAAWGARMGAAPPSGEQESQVRLPRPDA